MVRKWLLMLGVKMKYKREDEMSSFLKYALTDYSKSVMLDRCPDMVDGLKCVHRRVLQNVVNVTQSGKLKVASVTGSVIKTHPHSDQSISEVVTDMAKPFTNMIPLIDTKGNVGSYSKPHKHAAPRYLDVWCSEFTKDVFFNIDKNAIKYRDNITNTGKEPIRYIPVIPTALLTTTMTIAVGAKTEIVSLNFGDLCDVTIEYILRRKKGEISISGLEKYLMPDSPVHGYLLNSKQLQKAYSMGKHEGVKIISTGDLTIERDAIIINHVSMKNDFMKSTVDKFRQLRLQKHSIFNKIRLPESYDGRETSILSGDVVIPLKRSVSPFEVLDEIKKIISYKGSISQIPLYVNDVGIGVLVNHIRLLETWFSERYAAIVVSLKYTQRRLMNDFRKAEALVIFKDNLDYIQNVFKSVQVWEDAVDPLSKKFNLTRYQVRYISTVTLQQTSKTAREDLVIRREKAKRDLDTHREKFTDVYGLMITEITKLKTKYSEYTKRNLEILCCNTYVICNGGVIQLKNSELKKFKLEASDYPEHRLLKVPKPYNKYRYYIKDGILHDEELHDFEKEFTCDEFITRSTPIVGYFKYGEYVKRSIPNSKMIPTNVTLVGNKFARLGHDNSVTITTFKDLCKRIVDKTKAVCDLSISDKYVVVYCIKGTRNKGVVEVVDVGKKFKPKLCVEYNVIYFGPHGMRAIIDVPVGFKHGNRVFVIEPDIKSGEIIAVK